MRKTLLSILVGMALVTPTDILLAEPKSPKLAKCNGKQRRPANPYGSILPSVDPLNGTSTPAGETIERKGVDVFPEKTQTAPKAARPDGRPDAQVPPISSITTPTTNQSC